VARDFVENAISSFKQLGTGAYRTQARCSCRNAAKEDEYRFHLGAYARRDVFQLRFFKKALALYRTTALPLAWFAGGNVTMVADKMSGECA
jgi:hypothetical protein